MKNLNILLFALFTFALIPTAMAEPVDSKPPAHEQKNNVPNSTENGNFLEPQPADNADANHTGDKKHNKTHGKNVKDKPKDGGVKVDPR